MEMCGVRYQLIVTLLIGYLYRTYAVYKGSIHTKCSHVNMPLVLTCGQSEVIYIHQTILTDWPGSISASTCELPLCNQYCRASTQQHDIYFNGRQTAQYTFWRDNLIGHDFLSGNCNTSSSSNLVHVRYECLTVNRLTNVCSKTEISGVTSGFLTSPGFPGSPSSQQNGCQCELIASDNGIVTMTAVLINPVLTDQQPRWTFEVIDEKGKVQVLDTQAWFTTTVDLHSSSTIHVKFSSSGDTSDARVHFTSYPRGFWVKYTAFPLFSTIKVHCSAPSDNNGVSAVTVAVSCALAVAFILFTLTVVYFGRKWWRNKHPKLRIRRHSKTTPDGGRDNYGMEFDYTSDRWTESDVPDIGPGRCMSLPEIYLAQQIGKMRLEGQSSTPRKGRVEGRRKFSTVSLPSSSSCQLSMITNDIVREVDEFDDETGSYESFAMEIFHLEGITSDEIYV
ncbi:uncharacterized protein LOC110454169 isoform X2 [Mizuhopecten yessoensis]|uniref:uncharacterized protein LOC110454169 isoform X2 n=1 Tax=Mizuhopecten yessoensis TaxID=6573 RepID=UPI000B45B346|nr:uncharacterized protein LOC110454169 isoform X2 [Mizuhopecten yessoensis]